MEEVRPCPPLPPPSANPQVLTFLPWIANSCGWGHLRRQMPRGEEEKKRENGPSPINTANTFH